MNPLYCEYVFSLIHYEFVHFLPPTYKFAVSGMDFYQKTASNNNS